MVDSGASTTIIQHRVYEGLRQEFPLFVGPLESSQSRLLAANKQQLKVYGEAQIECHFLDMQLPITFVVADIGVPGLLGLDSLTGQFPHCFNLKTGQLYAPGKGTLQLHKKNEAKQGRLFSVGHTCVPPGHEVVLSCRIRTQNGRKPGGTGVVEGLVTFVEETGLIVGRAVVNTSNWTVPVLVVNPGNEAIVLPPHVEVAQLSRVEFVGSVLPEGETRTNSPSYCLAPHLQSLVDKCDSDLSNEQRARVAALLHKYQDLFRADGEPLQGRTSVVKHDIPTGTHRPIKMAARRLRGDRREIEENEIKKMLDANIIEPSTSAWSAPVVLVTKKDGSTRFCVDYRKLNDVTVKDAYPLPRIDDSLEALAGCKWFSVCDLASGYWQVELSEEAKEKSAFVTKSGLFQFKVMPFGLCNAPATFERLMETVLQGLMWDRCIVYLDDVISFGSTFSSALNHLEQIFQRFRHAHLQIKAQKCSLFQKQVDFLGHVVSRDGVSCDPKKIEAVQKWPVPNTVKTVRSFLGFVGYYRRFIKDFAHNAEPLTHLTKTEVPFVWRSQCQQAFEKLRQALISAPILSYPQPGAPYILDTDASQVGLGGVLSQVQAGEERVLAYCSRTLRPSQRRYCTTKREMLAAVSMCMHFRSYLRGQPFLLRTDHASLKWLTNFKETDGMLARWFSKLSQFSAKLEHRAGRRHGNADGLSRQCQQCKRNECPIQYMDELDSQPFLSPLQEFASSEDLDLIPYETGEDWVAAIQGSSRQAQIEASLETSDIRIHQNRDPTLTMVFQWCEKGSRPNWECVTRESREVRCLWTQWAELKIKMGCCIVLFLGQ